MITDLLLIAGIAALLMCAFCVVSLRQDKLTWIDVAWSVSMGVCAIAMAIVTGGDIVRRSVVASLLVLWAFRLSQHLVRHRLRGPEDGRYVDLREKLQFNKKVYMPAMYAAETLLVPLCLLPIHAIMSVSRSFGTIWDVLGVMIYLASLCGETLADAQLECFRKSSGNAKRTCRSGLWRYSRHPNYFFEWVHWWAYAVMAVGTPAFALTLVGPAVMFLFLYYITGIPHIERRALRSRGADYFQYQQTTSAFIPWVPKRQESLE